ncbi:MAG TPA: BtrH N-terminal domain-containing protein [Solirubrobacteraceae bacterium]|nr:BtrH N-terminal domain-containing protein [Solirubrobacteraceae bacterium]
MTESKHLKGRIRARMAHTGERYMTARRHVVGERPPAPADDHGWQLRGGLHPDSAAIANVLAHHGTEVSEALVLGVGGGLGAGYILWEFEAHHTPTLVLGFSNQWQYPGRWAAKTLERLGVPFELHETGGAKGAAARLDAALAAGRPALATVDRQEIGHWHLPAHASGRGGYPVVVHGSDGDRMRIDDRNLAPLTVERERLDAARARVGSYKHRLVVIEPAEITAGTLRTAVRAGLADAAEHLGARSDSFGLPAWRKWARMLTDTRGAKAWPNVFADERGLAGALLSAYEGIEPVGAYGGHLRGLYADFLDEAAALLEAPRLVEAAAAYRDVAALWHELAELALPSAVPEFAALREELAAVHESVVARGDAGHEEAAQAAGRMWELRARLDAAPPVEPDFARLGAALEAIYEAEAAAAALLTG